jgi:hypothetical protein
MRNLIASIATLALTLFFVTAAPAQTISKSQTGAVGVVVTCTDTSGNSIKCVLPQVSVVSASGVVPSGTSSDRVQGSSAALAANAGDPVLTGCVRATADPSISDGQRGNTRCGQAGRALVSFGPTATAANGIPNTVAYAAGHNDGTGNVQTPVATQNHLRNDTTLDQQFTCANTAPITVAAGATTQIVGLTASQTIRVCSVVLTMSATGTFKFIYGTGVDCVTGPADITSAMDLTTATPLVVSSGAGSVLRTASANALCGVAVTGNARGFVTYAKF